MVTELTDDDAGPTVRTPNDSTGRVTRVEDGVAYVEPDSEAPETVLAALGWDDAGAEAEDGSESGDGAGDRLPRTAIDEGEGGEITLLRDDADADLSTPARLTGVCTGGTVGTPRR